jgi:hypothetical protein
MDFLMWKLFFMNYVKLDFCLYTAEYNSLSMFRVGKSFYCDNLDKTSL